MKKTKFIIFILIFIFLVNVSAKEMHEYPVEALELLADTKMEECNICIKGLIKDAIEELDDFYKKKKIFVTSKENYLIKTNDCGQNEFTIKSNEKRKLYKNHAKYGKVYLPIVTFRFHTIANNLVGVDSKDYTDKKIAKSINALKRNRKKYQIEFEVIEYEYGDGKNFIYLQKEDKIQIQCKIISIKK